MIKPVESDAATCALLGDAESPLNNASTKEWLIKLNNKNQNFRINYKLDIPRCFLPAFDVFKSRNDNSLLKLKANLSVTGLYGLGSGVPVVSADPNKPSYSFILEIVFTYNYMTICIVQNMCLQTTKKGVEEPNLLGCILLCKLHQWDA